MKKNQIEDYPSIRAQAESLYKKTKLIKSPVLGEVYFTSEGFNHLMFKGKSERTKQAQMTKFKLLPIGKRTIEISTTYQEYLEQLIEVKKERHKKIVVESVIAKYWGFIAIINGAKVKTIVRQVGNGQKHFWSVIPDWNTTKYGNFHMIEKCTGDPQED